MEKICVPSHVSTTFFKDTAVILDARTNSYHALNNTGADFWKSFMEKGSFESALNEVLELYDYSSDLIRKDMEELVDSLLHAGLLKRVQS
ncbi:MAG: PqqD family peptide modification chaperone [Spirirestis rafaelensis WJT71-NPBG6]|jgi:hypothetical protein|nr:PqqD family peptide modification chaperone [Spirirestis rafaelensis WJT71-NPBG6]